MTKSLSFLLLFLFCYVEGYKVLIYSPRFGASHVSFIGKVADILVDEGMNVTILLPIMNPYFDSNGTKLAKTITIDTDPRVVQNYKNSRFKAGVWDNSQTNPLAEKLGMDFLLKNEKFDLGISEVFDLCGLGIFEAIGLKKHIIMQTAIMPDRVGQIFGAPNLPAIVPAYYSHKGMSMNYFERALNLFKTLFGQWWTDSVREAIEEVYKKEFGQKVDLYKKIQEASFVITNTDPLVDFPRPSSERIVNIGGIGVPEPKPLSALWEKVITTRKATVLVSFGTVAQSQFMPGAMKKSLLEAFKRFPDVTFIFKYEEDSHDITISLKAIPTW
ncbi:hypothetical protein L596_026013 [Steinernema carpocapsae]|uniref:glucuronosyltransferase n=1 Tax=Steinernema carpocapsae TaxID=34508 RepID=A0A4U5M049_STECR|nr:hypothetical protein L596_026013 [Steinernema carpocapsae]